jgi:hypothetical protein
VELIPYQDFGELRIREFFPDDAQFFLDDTGSTECAFGPAATEGLAFTYDCKSSASVRRNGFHDVLGGGRPELPESMNLGGAK